MLNHDAAALNSFFAQASYALLQLGDDRNAWIHTASGLARDASAPLAYVGGLCTFAHKG